MEGLMPNCGIFAETKPRLGRMCNVPHLVNNSSSRIKTLRENSFQIQGPQLFNSLPMPMDEPNISGCEYTPRACDMYRKPFKFYK